MSDDYHNISDNDTVYDTWFAECTLNLNDDYRRIFLFIFYLFIFMVGLAENSLVVWVNWHRRHSANGVLFCVMNVSMSDLMVLLTLPFFMLEITINHVWLWGRFLCHVTKFIYAVNLYSSSLFLAFMTLERYLSLSQPSSPGCFPVGGWRRWMLCGGLWLFSLFLSLMESAHTDLVEWDEPACFIMPEHNYIEWYMVINCLNLIFQFIIPTSIIITCNVLIARAVRSAPDVQGRREVWLVHVYSLVFVLCWLPYHLVTFLLMVDISLDFLNCNSMDVLYFSSTLVQGLSLLHCVANPILYNFLSKSFRTNLINHVVQHIPREVTGDAAWTGTGKQRRLSNMSSSQSDVCS